MRILLHSYFREKGGSESRESKEARNNGRDYAADLKLLVAEHLKLQHEYARVRQQLVEKNASLVAIERMERADRRGDGLLSPTAGGQRSPCTPNSLSELSSIPELEPQTHMNDLNNNNSSNGHSNGTNRSRDSVSSDAKLFFPSILNEMTEK